MHALTFTAALALLSQGAAADRTEGRVVQATAARAYLDAGADDGLAKGAEITLLRAGAEVARCRVDAVAARSASCGVTGARPGDAFALPGRPAGEAPRLLPPPPAPATLRAQRAALAAAPVQVVAFTAPERARAAGAASTVSVELSEVAWVATSASPFVGTRAALSIRQADVGRGLRLDVDAMATRWTTRPDSRFRAGDASRLEVWQASLSRDAGPGGLAFAVGRILPWRIPGATIFDGATAGLRGERWEVGAFAGFVPHPSNLDPTTDRAAGGGYWTWYRPLASGVTVSDEGRLAVVRSPELGTRFEAETRAAARLGARLDLSGSVRLGLGGEAQAPGGLDAARLELAGRPVKRLRVAGWLAYDGLEPPEDAEPSILPGRSRRLEGSVGWETRNVRLTALGGMAADLESDLDRRWVGPVLDLPRLLFRRGGISVGYLEEVGWTDGRSAWVQAIYRPWSRFRILGRFAWSHAPALAVGGNDLAATLGAYADLGQTFSARITATVRGSLPSGEAASEQGGGTVLAALTARY